MSKYYAVKVGFEPGIYKDWETAKKQVDKYRGAIYKSFRREDEALMFMDNGNKIVVLKDDIDVLVYTDGSCVNNVGGYGIIIIENPSVDIKNNIHKEYNGYVPYELCTNNVAELYAIYQVLIILSNDNCKKIMIRTDSKYCINVLTIKKEPIKNVQLIKNNFNLLKSFTNIEFNHVYGHNHEYYNEKTDKLANAGRLLI